MHVRKQNRYFKMAYTQAKQKSVKFPLYLLVFIYEIEA